MAESHDQHLQQKGGGEHTSSCHHAIPHTLESLTPEHIKNVQERVQQHAHLHHIPLQKSNSDIKMADHPMAPKLIVKDIMSEKVVTVTPNDTLAEAFVLMGQKPFRRLPVVESPGSRKVVGIISDRHIRLAANSPFMGDQSKTFELLRDHKVGEVMQRGVVTVESNELIVEAAKEMRVANVGGLPVLDPKTGLLVGMLTRTDLLDHLIRTLEPLVPHQAYDIFEPEGQQEKREAEEECPCTVQMI